jgi:hypothetical protein
VSVWVVVRLFWVERFWVEDAEPDCEPFTVLLPYVELEDELGCVDVEDDEPDVPSEPETLALPDPFNVDEDLSLWVPLRIDELEPVEDEGWVRVELEEPTELPEFSELLEVEDDDEGDVVCREVDVEEPLGLELLPVEDRSCDDVWAWRPRAAAKSAAVPQVISLAGVFMLAMAY